MCKWIVSNPVVKTRTDTVTDETDDSFITTITTVTVVTAQKNSPPGNY